MELSGNSKVVAGTVRSWKFAIVEIVEHGWVIGDKVPFGEQIRVL